MVIDACGLSCPQPVILTMKAMERDESPLEILVDNNAACENIQRLAESKRYKVSIVSLDDKFRLILKKELSPAP